VNNNPFLLQPAVFVSTDDPNVITLANAMASEKSLGLYDRWQVFMVPGERLNASPTDNIARFGPGEEFLNSLLNLFVALECQVRSFLSSCPAPSSPPPS
jgi:hypothetical protein